MCAVEDKDIYPYLKGVLFLLLGKNHVTNWFIKLITNKKVFSYLEYNIEGDTAWCTKSLISPTAPDPDSQWRV